MLQIKRGNATLIKKDIFKNLMWYVLPDSNKQYPLTIERVKKIRSLNMQNIIPEEMEAVEVTSSKPKEVEPAFVDVVGHITLKSLEKADKKKAQRQQGPQRQGGGQQQQRGIQIQPKGIPPQPRQEGGVQKQPLQPRQGGNNPQQRARPDNRPNQAPRQKMQPPQRRPPGSTDAPKKD
jgi:hypothetical protein